MIVFEGVNMSSFYQVEPTLENYWRAIVLFGENTASYKFAFAKALYDLKPAKNDLVRFEELPMCQDSCRLK